MCAMQICGSWFQLQTIPFRMHHVTRRRTTRIHQRFTVDAAHRFYLLVSIRVPSCSELFIICPISIQPNPVFERTGGILFPRIHLWPLIVFPPSSLPSSSLFLRLCQYLLLIFFYKYLLSISIVLTLCLFIYFHNSFLISIICYYSSCSISLVSILSIIPLLIIPFLFSYFKLFLLLSFNRQIYRLLVESFFNFL